MLGAVAILTIWSLLMRSRPALVVYCAHDSIHAEAVLREFERRTDISVRVRYDTEATKSLGLVELLSREGRNPRCDVFWNNEVLGTMRLREEGLLVAYRGAGFERIPAAYKDPEGYWTGFAARARVWIVNTERLQPTSAAIQAKIAAGTESGDLSFLALAKPLYGTTRTQYTVLWDLWGEDGVRSWHRQWRDAGVREVAGNATVKNLVASGGCDLGLTDTDDFFLALDEDRPVAMVPVEVDGDRTICIPNAVAIVKGTRMLEEARMLLDYLLSEEVELSLAHSRSRQIPLGPVDPQELPREVRDLRGLVPRARSLGALDRARRECLTWLLSEYVR